MAEPTLRWANVEKAVRAHLAGLLTVPVQTETTAKTTGDYVLIQRTGGGGAWIDKDVDIETTVYSTERGTMWDLAATVESAMWGLAAHNADGVYIDDVQVAFGFAVDPPTNQNARAATATFTLTVRPVRA